MSDPSNSATGAASSDNPKRGKVLTVLALIGAGVAGIAAFGENIGKIGTYSKQFCQYLKICSPDPLPSAPPLPPLSLPVHVTGWMGGGHNQLEQCNPMLAKHRAENPKYNIDMKTSEEHKKDVFGKVEYKYTCVFFGSPR